jgi:acyl-coenzyme A thioesterase PaaI-like protein
VLPFDEKLIGNPILPAIHGGVTAAFLEVTAIIELAWSLFWEDMEAGRIDPAGRCRTRIAAALPKTIDFTVDYLRSGLPRDAYAGRGSTGRGGAMPACMSRPGRTTAPGFSPRRRAIS